MTLFQSSDRQGFLVSIDLNQPKNELIEKLMTWMREEHSDIFFNEIEMHEGGEIKINFVNPKLKMIVDSIEFWGDNGVFTLEAVETEKII